MAGGTVMVLGASGVFGSRLCRLLANERQGAVIAAGRDPARLDAVKCAIRRTAPAAAVTTRRIALSEGLTPQALQGVDVVVHAAGPFQGQDYAVARACIAAGVPYVDLADGREFVAGFAALDGEAHAAGVLAVSGASSVPGLSGAAVATLAPAFARLERIAIRISPGNRAPRGEAVVRAILSYVGKPVAMAGGAGHGWQDLHRLQIACPGAPPLPPRWFSLCDVPDLALWPMRYPGVSRVTFHAGLDLAVLHLGLWALSWPVRWGWLRSLASFARPFTRIAGWLEGLGTDRGGMQVELAGRDAEGRALTRRWSLVAELGEGPWIPVLPALLVVRKLLAGELPRGGAMPCLDLFTLQEIERELRRFEIVTAVA